MQSREVLDMSSEIIAFWQNDSSGTISQSLEHYCSHKEFSQILFFLITSLLCHFVITEIIYLIICGPQTLVRSRSFVHPDPIFTSFGMASPTLRMHGLEDSCTVSPWHTNLQAVNVQRCERVSSSIKEPEPVPSTSGVNDTATCLPSPIADDPSAPPSPTSSPFSSQ